MGFISWMWRGFWGRLNRDSAIPSPPVVMQWTCSAQNQAGCIKPAALPQTDYNNKRHKREVTAAHQPNKARARVCVCVREKRNYNPAQAQHGGHKERNLLETFSVFMLVFAEFVSRLWRADPVHLYVRTQGYGHLCGHLAEQCAWRGFEEHRYAAEGDSLAAERDDHEPKRDHQRIDLKVGSVWEPEWNRARGRAARGQKEGGWDQKHNGGCIEGPRWHFDATITDFTVPEAEIRKSWGRAAASEEFIALWAQSFVD